MGEQYVMTLENGTDQPWHEVCGVPPQARSVPSSAQATWTIEYGVCIADFDKDERKYTGKQFASAYLGNVYKVDTLDGIPSIDTKPTATGSSDQIVLKKQYCSTSH